MVYSTVTVTSTKGLAYVFVLVSVISQRVFWLAVMVGVDAEDVTGDTVMGAFGVVDWLAAVADLRAEDVTGDVVKD